MVQQRNDRRIVVANHSEMKRGDPLPEAIRATRPLLINALSISCVAMLKGWHSAVEDNPMKLGCTAFDEDERHDQ